MITLFKKIWKNIKNAISSDELRREFLFRIISVALALTALVMGIVDVFTRDYSVAILLLGSSVLFGLNAVLVGIKKIRNAVYCLFVTEVTVLLGHFLVGGISNGFSALWILLIPSFAMLIFGIKWGGIFSSFAFVLTVFALWTPIGRSLLHHQYTQEFCLRFPLFYLSVFLTSLFLEFVRYETQKQLEHTKQQYLSLYRRDALTGLFNRYGIFEFVDTVFSNEGKKKISAVMFDIDDFKAFNDEHGHEFGDEVLKVVSQTIQNTVCSECQCCRWGGEEFLLLMGCNHDPVEFADELRRTINKTPVTFGGVTVTVSVSMGVCVALSPIEKDDVQRLINCADKAMYKSKVAGKNQTTICFFEEETAPEKQ